MSTGTIVIAAVASLLSLGASVAFTIALLIRLPPDYFVREELPPRSWAWRVARNLGGLLLVAAGIVLSLPGVPGQGMLTILLGLMLMDIPGKRRLVRALFGRAIVHRAINGIRLRYGKPPMQIHADPALEQTNE